MPFSFCPRLTLSVLLLFPVRLGTAQGQSSLFDGKSFVGWEGETTPRNEFRASVHECAKFDRRVKFMIQGTEGRNAGLRFRSKRIPRHHRYDADELHDLIRFLAELGQPSFAR